MDQELLDKHGELILATREELLQIINALSRLHLPEDATAVVLLIAAARVTMTREALEMEQVRELDGREVCR